MPRIDAVASSAEVVKFMVIRNVASEIDVSEYMCTNIDVGTLIGKLFGNKKKRITFTSFVPIAALSSGPFPTTSGTVDFKLSEEAQKYWYMFTHGQGSCNALSAKTAREPWQTAYGIVATERGKV